MQTQKMVLFVGGELVAQVVADAGDVAALNPAVARSQINAGDV
ncbi:hypothetical protein AB0T83_01050 [Fluviibacterium sp. DFM31]|uniref:Uncharacterized protein n=1 Tax=Meridianimarinicoccus marinus TaxID=3231483 RepID=A0ABV3L1I5_9RHOB